MDEKVDVEVGCVTRYSCITCINFDQFWTSGLTYTFFISTDFFQLSLSVFMEKPVFRLKRA